MTEIDKDWCMNMAKREEGDIAAGKLAMDPMTTELPIVTQADIDSIIQDVCELDNNPFDGMGTDDVWCSISDLRVILERNLASNTEAATLIAELVDALREIAGTGSPDFLSHSQKIATAALSKAGQRG